MLLNLFLYVNSGTHCAIVNLTFLLGLNFFTSIANKSSSQEIGLTMDYEHLGADELCEIDHDLSCPFLDLSYPIPS